MAVPQLGKEEEKVQNRKRPHAQKGNKRGLNNRHMGTLSISVHEDKEGMSKTLFPRHPNTGGGQNHQETFVT